jgi:hypothetical protein
MSPKRFIAATANVKIIRANQSPTFKVFCKARYRVFKSACNYLLALTTLKSLATLIILNRAKLNSAEIEPSVDAELRTTIAKSNLFALSPKPY